MATDKLSATALATLIQKVITTAVATNVTGATNASPTNILSTAHGLNTGDFAVIMGVGGNTGANVVAQVTKIDANHVTIPVDTGAGSSYTSGGTIAKLTISQWLGDCTLDQLKQIIDDAARVKDQPGVSLTSLFPAGLVP